MKQTPGGLYLPDSSITDAERAQIIEAHQLLKENDPEYPLEVCFFMGQIIREFMGWEMVAVRCLLQRRNSKKVGWQHVANEHPQRFFVDAALQQFDYPRRGFVPGAMEEPAPDDLLPYLEQPLPEVALLPLETSLFELDLRNMERVRDFPMHSLVREILESFTK
jgi:hypothetical protein